MFIAVTSTVSVSSPAVMALIITQGCGLMMRDAGFFHAILYLKAISLGLFFLFIKVWESIYESRLALLRLSRSRLYLYEAVDSRYYFYEAVEHCGECAVALGHTASADVC